MSGTSRQVFVNGKHFASISAAAEEASHLTGKKIDRWKISHALEWGKGFVEGIAVSEKPPETPAAPQSDGKKRAPLMRPPVHGIPPHWH